MNSIFSAILGLFKAGQETEPPKYEASANFDLENVSVFFERLNRNLGFALNVEVLTDFVESTPVNDEWELHTEAIYEGASMPLELRVHKDDVDSPDIYFFTTSRSMAESISAEILAFVEEHGL